MENQTQTDPPVASTALFGFFKCRPTRDGEVWESWGALERMKADSIITELSEPIHFCFAKTEDEAVQNLTNEMDAAYGKRRWWRQYATPHSLPNTQAQPPATAASADTHTNQ